MNYEQKKYIKFAVLIISIIIVMVLIAVIEISLYNNIQIKQENAKNICNYNDLQFIVEHELIECGQFDNNGELLQIIKFRNDWKEKK